MLMEKMALRRIDTKGGREVVGWMWCGDSDVEYSLYEVDWLCLVGVSEDMGMVLPQSR
jgi:hypothetical protein